MTDKSPNQDFIDSVSSSYNAIGYPPNLLQRNYLYNDFLSQSALTRTVDLAVFAQYPYTYRSACFAHRVVNGELDSSKLANEIRSIGALQIFISRPNQTEIWTNKSNKVVFKESIPTSHLTSYISEKKNVWSPSELLRLKSGFQSPSSTQLDFIDIGLLPALEHEASKKIDSLIRSVLHRAEEKLKEETKKTDPADLFRAVFGLLTAKLFVDRDIVDLRLDNPQEALTFVSTHFGNGLGRVSVPAPILKDVSSEIASSLSFQNLSVDTLTYIYENTFVSAKSRKQFGIHSTPSYIADYILRQIPLEQLPESEWNVFDPMCGHGIFLISAMRRIGELLQTSWDGPTRHQFFKQHLTGVEKDLFSVEVAKLSLTLADFPEKDGWNILHRDVFDKDILAKEISKTKILIGNPPFEKQEGYRPDTPKPKLLLEKVLPALAQDSLFGMVLPASFLDGSDYRKQRINLLDDYELINITKLPDGVFEYADSETCVIVAKRSKHSGKSSFSFVKKSDLKNFKISLQPTFLERVEKEYFRTQTKGALRVPILKEIWEFLAANESISDVAEFAIGVQYDKGVVRKNRSAVIRQSSFRGSRRGISQVTDAFGEYFLNQHEYLSTERSLRRRNAWQLDWDIPKVIVPAARLSRGAWRHAAVIDRSGLLVHRNFYVCWPKKKTVSVESLAALLNSPLAQAYAFAHNYQQSTREWTYEKIPIPRAFERAVPSIDASVKEYVLCLKRQDFDKAKRVLMRIDAHVLQLYELPPRLERKLLDLFWQEKRRVPFAFDGYIPPENTSWIPLHIYISDAYREGTLPRILQSVPETGDSEFTDYLKSLGREDDIKS